MIFSHKKIYWFLGIVLGALLLSTDGCSSLKNQASKYQKEVAPLINEFDQIQGDYKKLVDKAREDMHYTTQDFLADLDNLKNRTTSTKEAMQKINVPEDMNAIHELGTLSIATFDDFLRDAQISLTKQDQVFTVHKTRDQALLLYKQYKEKIQGALNGKNIP